MLDLWKPCTAWIKRTSCLFFNSDRSGWLLSMKVVEPKSLDEKRPLVIPDARDWMLWQKTPRVRKLSSFPNQEETTLCSLIIRKTTVVKSVRKQNNRSQVWSKTQEARERDCIFFKIRRLEHSRSHKICTWKGVEMRTQKKALIVQGDFTKCIQRYPMKTKGTSE